MRRAVPTVAAALLLAGPTVLAFFSGGYYDEPRLVAAIVAWLAVLALTAVGPAPLPRTLAGRLAVGGLAGLTAWSALSVSWAPLGGPAADNVQRLLLYLGALLTAIAVLRSPRTSRWVEPALAGGATIVIGYGIAGRLLPGMLDLARSASAGGRLEQPITYWNAEGALAAMGLILCARLAGDATRPIAVRALAAAAAAPLGAGVYLSYSRGAIAVTLVGMLVLVAAAPTGGQFRAAALALGAGAAAAACSSAFPGVASLAGSHGDRVRDGAVMLVLMLLLAAGAAYLATRLRHRGSGVDEQARPTRGLAAVAASISIAVVAGLVIGGIAEKPSRAELAAGASAGRLTTISSNRYEYWRVGVEAFERRPLTGLGSAGFRVEWLRERDIPEAVKDAHSLEIEIAAELGLAGLLALVLMVGGVALAARQALARSPAAAAGCCAAALAWFLHSSIDWNWQLPAVSLPAMVLAGALVAHAEARPRAVTTIGREADQAAAAH